ncbi:MAG: pyridoxal phosphate-dependent aminotransferase [Chloroflexales bacterium]|nr:pyridoxal phosphate-dependent aminotransferase [Chloroflexales bacterium]
MITLSGGTPDFPTPPHVVEAGRKALADGHTTYTPWAGLPELREAIAHSLLRESGLKVDPKSEIIVTAGAQAAMLSVILALVDVGDEIIVPVPFYDEYRRDIVLAGGTMVAVPTKETANFEVDPAAIERAITPRTKGIILISPANPTGAVLPRTTLERIAEIARRHDLLVISDELYDRFVYEDYEHVSIASLPGMWDRTVVIKGFSKTYSMTGWRVGYVAGRSEIMHLLAPITHGMTICAPSASQWAALAALSGPHDWFDEVLTTYDRRRRLWMRGLDAMGLTYGYPKGAYYLTLNITSTGLTSQQFAVAMRDEAHVIVGGGGGTSDPYNEGYNRASLTMPYERIEEGLARMAPVVAKYQAQKS